MLDQRLSYHLLLGAVAEEWVPASEMLGKVISDLAIGDSFIMTFEDGHVVKLSDNMQNCCETRYLRTDDDLDSLVGGVFIDLIIKPATLEDTEYCVRECVFFEIVTTKGSVVLSAHNDNNGYYGGFNLKFEEVK